MLSTANINRVNRVAAGSSASGAERIATADGQNVQERNLRLRIVNFGTLMENHSPSVAPACRNPWDTRPT